MGVYICNKKSPHNEDLEKTYSYVNLPEIVSSSRSCWTSFINLFRCSSITTSILPPSYIIVVFTHFVNIKKKRLECHLYGQLIGILLCSSTMFQMRQLLLEKKKQELSEYKAIYMIKDYFPLLFRAMKEDPNELVMILHRLYQLLKKNGRKCHRYKKQTVFDILGVVYEKTVKPRQAA